MTEYFDLNGDGFADAVDRNLDGYVDAVDTDGDGYLDTFDTDFDGLADTAPGYDPYAGHGGYDPYGGYGGDDPYGGHGYGGGAYTAGELDAGYSATDSSFIEPSRFADDSSLISSNDLSSVL